MSKTLLRQTLIKNIFDIFVDLLIFFHFHYMKQPIISLEMPVPSQGHYGFHSFPVVD
jgi:hypothetical protein